MIRIDAASVLVQWAAGGWVFLWVTTRRREVGLGYGWLQRAVFLLMAAGSLVAALATQVVWTRDVATLAFMAAGGVALAVSIARRSAGVSGQRELRERRSERVAEMTGIDRAEPTVDDSAVEFPPHLDLVVAAVGLVAVLFASIDAGDPVALSIARGGGQCLVPRRRVRRHAARSLVSGTARPGERTDPGTGPLDRHRLVA